jgi:hypothetical protein
MPRQPPRRRRFPCTTSTNIGRFEGHQLVHLFSNNPSLIFAAGLNTPDNPWDTLGAVYVPLGDLFNPSTKHDEGLGYRRREKSRRHPWKETLGFTLEILAWVCYVR